MDTIKLYDRDAYTTKFEGKVLTCEKKGENFEVILDQSCFFPEEGGQSPDKGYLEDAKVLDVQIVKNTIIHTVDKPLEEGIMVKGEIDWKHRFSNMQQHSGEHIFSGLVYKNYGYSNVGFHLSDQIVTMDFDGPLSLEQVEELEWKVNEAISENGKVKAWYPEKEELAKLEYRSKKKLEGAIRIVEIEGYDRCACCAPHVARTGEIGGFKIQSLQNYKAGVRISYLCGFRALREARKKAKIISELSGILTTNQELLADSVTKLKNQTQSLKMQYNHAKQELMEKAVSEIPDEEKHVILFEKDVDTSVARTVVNRLVEKHDGVSAVFVGSEDNGYTFLIGSKSVDCREIAKLFREQFHASGGGSEAMVQGSVTASKEELIKTLKQL